MSKISPSDAAFLAREVYAVQDESQLKFFLNSSLSGRSWEQINEAQEQPCTIESAYLP